MIDFLLFVKTCLFSQEAKENLAASTSKLKEAERERDLLNKQLETTMPAVSMLLLYSTQEDVKRSVVFAEI